MDTDVRLRLWQKNDRQMLATLANNIRIWTNVRDRLPHPYTLANADEFIQFCQSKKPASVLAIEYKGALAGCIGIELQDDIFHRSAEIGYWIGEPFWGKNIATTAVHQMLQHVQQHFGYLVRVYAKIFEHNLPSMRVLEKNEFHLEAIHRKSVTKNKIVMDEYVWVLLL
ncbi:MAG: GNAT family protein [Agriterribacter sp.]